VPHYYHLKLKYFFIFTDQIFDLLFSIISQHDQLSAEIFFSKIIFWLKILDQQTPIPLYEMSDVPFLELLPFASLVPVDF